MKTYFRQRIHRNPPIAVVLLDRLVGDHRRIVGDAGPGEERIERAEIGRNEIMRAVRLHRHERRSASLGGRQIFCDERSQRIGAFGRSRLVARESRGRPQEANSERKPRKDTARLARAR